MAKEIEIQTAEGGNPVTVMDMLEEDRCKVISLKGEIQSVKCMYDIHSQNSKRVCYVATGEELV